MGKPLPYLCAAVLALGACVGGIGGGDDGDGVQNATTQRLVERDIEAPEVFQVTDAGVWDGRPSLGGVWVAHSATDEPERVIIRNESNGQFVIGALFRRDADLPGPALQVSSDAADALDMQAGTPAQLNVTALRRQEGADDAAPAPAAAVSPDSAAGLGAPQDIDTQSLDADTSLVAAAPVAATPIPAPAATPAPTSTLDRPFIQIGIFSEEQNAENTATALRGAGLSPQINEQRSAGKTFFRVTVGPATSIAGRAASLETVKGLGFADAYFVSS